MYWNIQKPINQDPAIIGSMYFSAEKSVVIDATNVGLDSTNVRAVPAGLFVARVGGVDRFLPRDTVRETAVGTGAATVKVNYPELFKVGDVLYATEPEGLITLADTWAADDTVTIRLRERSLGIETAYTHTQVGANLAALDDELVTALNLSSNPLAQYARFEVGTAGQVKVFSKGLEFELEVAVVTAGDGVAAVTTQVDPTPRLIGTIASIDNVNKTITLGANAAVALAVGGQVGTLTEEIYGLYNHSIDFTDKPVVVIKAIDRADRVYLAQMPYFDHQLMARFPRMKFVNPIG
jgi:hypothetical protein